MRNRLLHGLAAVGLLMAVVSPRTLQAAVLYDFTTDQSNYTVLPNGTTTILVFLRETLTGGSPSTLAAEDGLFSSVARVTRTTSPSAPATITAASRDTTNFNDFNDSAVLSGGTAANVGGTRSLSAANGTPVIVDSATVRRVSVGSVTIQAGLTPLQTTTFTVADRPGSTDTLTWTTGQQLDGLIQPQTFTVTVIPEPATATVFGAVAAGLLLRRRSRVCL